MLKIRLFYNGFIKFDLPYINTGALELQEQYMLKIFAKTQIFYIVATKRRLPKAASSFIFC